MKRPSFQFYPNDWLSAPDLRACSLGARGLWMDMICLMHQGYPYGHLTINGKVVLEGTLAKLVGLAEDELKPLLSELEELGIFSRTDDGIIFSRRMVADEKLREVRAAGGFKALQNPNVPRPKLDKEGIPSTNTTEEDHEPIPSSSSSSSSSSSKEEEVVTNKKPSASRGKPRSASRVKDCDEDFLTELQARDAYQRIDVRRLYSKMVVWCEQKGKQPTRMRLINWLNREDVPMSRNGQAGSQTASPQSHFDHAQCAKCFDKKFIGRTPCPQCNPTGVYPAYIPRDQRA